MNINSFLKSIYLGDRFCNGINIDSMQDRIEICVNRISRIKDGMDNWDFYSDDDIENGSIIFDGVKQFRWVSESGGIPNDGIYSINLLSQTEDYFEIAVVIGSVNTEAITSEVTLNITAKDCYLMDPIQPGKKIYSR